MADNFADLINAQPDGWVSAMGLRFVSVTLDEVVAELVVGKPHLQPHGIVHGGVYCGMVETVASVGAGINARARNGQTVVGLENTTSFLRAVRSGATLRATARPLTRGRRTHVWDVTVGDETGKVVATGRVRLLCLEAGSDLAGEKAGTA
jgi:uncharacterized protein (TIGR00369 family)